MRMNMKHKSTTCNRRVRAARDGAELPQSWRLAAAGDRFPPGGPRRPRFADDRTMGVLASGSGGCR